MSAERKSDNPPLSSRGRGSSSEGDKDFNNIKGNRTRTYQKRSEVKAPAPSPLARHRMTLRELQLVLPQENSDLDSEEDKEYYLDRLLQEDRKVKST